ncbi:MAG: diguanylate cyclase, partial [Lachnospiraceae bacterium]
LRMKRFDDKNGTDDKKKRKRILFMAGMIAVIIITATLFYFNSFVMKTENSRARDSLLEWTEQNAALVGSRIDMYYDLLECAADYISDMPLDEVQTEEMLREKFHRHTEKFDSLKIISEDGRCVQDGQAYSLKEYFLMAMLGNRGLAENGYSYADGGILSVPVKNEAQQIKGVLCGTLPCSSLDVYGKADRRKGYAGLFVMDNHGKYIVPDGGNDTFGNDFLTWLEGRELSLPISDIKSQMDSGFRYYFAISDEDGDYMVTAAPVDGTKLFAVTMADNRYIHQAGLRYRIWVFVITLVIILSLIVVIGVYLYFRREDRIAIRNLNRQLMLNEETYRITARESDLCVFTYDVETEQIQFLNDKYQNLGLNQSELSVPVLLRKIREINPETCSVLRNIFARADSAEALHSQKAKVWAGGRMRYLQIKTTNLYDESGKVSRMVGSIEDITDMENDMLKLQKEARTDLLTGAMNRAAGTSAINRMLVQELHPGCVNTFAIVDLDNFKTLNDVMGHMWGDRALCEVVLIMKKHCRAQDIVCRLGGDEFVVFLPDMTREAAEESLRVLSAKLHIDYVKENLEVMISASMGIVFSDGRDITFQDLYEEADGCLYQVKRTFKGSYHISDRAGREKAD